MNTAERGLLASLSFVVTISSLWLAECVGGPAARFIFGVPAGFREDFTSPWALRQAFLVQVFFLAVAFLVLGAAVGAWTSKKFGYRDALWGANPITVGIGSATYKMTHHWARLEDMLPEYDSLRIFAVFCFISPVAFAFFLYVGVSAMRRWQTRR